MAVLCVVGTGRSAGKTALVGALAQGLREAGRTVALAKASVVNSPSPGPDPDSAFYPLIVPGNPQTPGLPLVVHQDADPSSDFKLWRDLLSPALSAQVSLLEGGDCLPTEEQATQSAKAVAEALDAQVLLVAPYQHGALVQQIGEAATFFGSRLLGVLINKVPRYQTIHLSREIAPQLQAAGVRLLGAIPEDRQLAAPTLRQVAEQLEGEFLLLQEEGDGLVEHIMVGGWFLDEGRSVFSQRERKAVLVRGDRPDLQMAALETDTVGLILTGGKPPVQYTIYHAETQRVPLVATRLGTVEAMERLAGIHQRVTVHHPQKIRRFKDLLESTGALANIFTAWGVPAPQSASAASRAI